MKKTISTVLCLILVFALASTAYATGNPITNTDGGTTAQTPVYMNTDRVVLSFEITESVTLTAANTALTSTSLNVKSDMTYGQIKVTGISAQAATGWTIQADNTDWANLAVNTQKLSLMYQGVDLPKTGMSDVLNPGASKNYEFTGHTAPRNANLTNEQVADITVTVALNEA